MSETNGIVYVKLGGSFITYKDKPFSINYSALEKTVSIISRTMDRVKLILGNGGGSFAHTIVQMYRDKSVDVLLTHCQNSTRKLNTIVVNYLIEHGVRATGIQTSAIMVYEKGEYSVWVKPIQQALEHGLIPVVYGECIFSDNGYTIVSTEKVFSILSRYFQPKRIVLLTDVPGIHTCDPKECSDAKLIKKITGENLDEVLNLLRKASSMDATGSIYGKVLSMARLSRETCVDVHVVSGFDIESSIKAILGLEYVNGTLIATY